MLNLEEIKIMSNNCCGKSISAKLQAATQARNQGMDCPQALMAAYQEELGEKLSAAEDLAAHMPEILGESELCDIFAVTFAIIVQLTGIEDSYAETIDRLRKEYGTSKCGSGGEDAPVCTQRMKDCVLMIQWAIRRCGG